MTRQHDPLNPRAQAAAKEADSRVKQLQAEQLREDMRWLMSDPRGRRLMWSWLADAGIYRTSFTGNSETFFREGQRNMGLKLQAQVMQHCPERFAEMMLEHQPPAPEAPAG